MYPAHHSGEVDDSTIGVIEAVSPGRLEVALRTDAPHGTGLREGTFHRFPRLNSYVVIPSERGPIIALITWVGVDARAPGFSPEDDRIALPSPRRRLHALPLGVLRSDGPNDGTQDYSPVLDRGVLVFPTVGDPVRLPTKNEAAAVVPRPKDSTHAFAVGTAPMAGGGLVVVDPDRLFGRHLAVLGNTGSGKSCSVVQILRQAFSASSLDKALPSRIPKGFRVVVLDLNDEFSDAFSDFPSEALPVRRFSAAPDEGELQFRVPSWAWNYEEWLSFSGASMRGQAPQLRKTLQFLRGGRRGTSTAFVLRLVAIRRLAEAAIQFPDQDKEDVKDNLNLLAQAKDVGSAMKDHDDAEIADAAKQFEADVSLVLASRMNPPGDKYPFKFDPSPLKLEEWEKLLASAAALLDAAGVPSLSSTAIDNVDAPRPFAEEDLVGLLPLVAAESGADAQRWVDPLLERIRIACADHRWRAISGWQDEESLEGWISEYLGTGDDSQVSIVDLSLVPNHLLHLVVGVFVRLLLEAVERHRRTHGYSPPLLLVVEEAHNLIRRHAARGEEDAPVPAIRLCRESFERVAREGRKFGLSMIVSSQRPSELSETVLSQCNTFLVHRIVNDHDQDLVRRLVPDNLGGLLAELPALPSQVGLLMGWAVELPTVVRMFDLDSSVQPRSADPPLGRTWAGDLDRTALWPQVVADWQELES